MVVTWWYIKALSIGQNVAYVFDLWIHLPSPLSVQKSDNLQYVTLDCWVAGTNDSLTYVFWCSKYYFFSWFLAKFFSKILSIYFFNFVILWKNKKINWKNFVKNFTINHEKKIILGASDASFVPSSKQHSITIL